MERPHPCQSRPRPLCCAHAGDRDQLDALLQSGIFGRNRRGMHSAIGVRPRRSPLAMRRNAWGCDRPAFRGARRTGAISRSRRRSPAGDRPVSWPRQASGFAARRGLRAPDRSRTRAHQIARTIYRHAARWHDAAGPLRTVLLDFRDGIATLRLNRPDKGIAIDESMAADLAEARNANCRGRERRPRRP